ncbi:unnamed protein product [Gadus morhua 'NCC']
MFNSHFAETIHIIFVVALQYLFREIYKMVLNQLCLQSRSCILPLKASINFRITGQMCKLMFYLLRHMRLGMEVNLFYYPPHHIDHTIIKLSLLSHQTTHW